MANVSIYAAFERMWAHVVNALSGKANQTDLDSLSSEFNSHTHNYAGSSSAGGSANSAVKWSTARIINGMSVDGSTNRVNYGECSTDAATTAKTVSCTGFSLVTGAEITVKFTVSNTASNPTLNVNSTGAKPIYYRGSAITTSYLAANRTYTFRYDGTSWNLVGDINVDTNTDTKVTQTATTTSADYRVLFSGTADDTSRAETARKSSNLKFNPSTGTLTATTFSGALDSSNLSSAVPVSKGGTGATTFTSGAALIGAGTGAVTTRAITNNTALTHIAYNTNLMTTNTLAFWNGAYSSAGSSNLAYCVKGAFGTIVTKNAGDYAAASHGHTFQVVEISHSTPAIDFHFNNSTADYTSRIIEASSGELSVIGALAVGGRLTVTNTVVVTGVLNPQGGCEIDGNLSVSGHIYAKGANEDPISSSYAINARIGDDGRIRKVSSSSIRYKNHISDLTYEDIEPLYTIPTHWFKYKPEYIEQEDMRFDTPIPGYYVEDWMDVMPIAIDLNKDGLPEMWNQNIVIPLTFEMVKGNHNRINDHAKEIDTLKAENANLRATNEKYEERLAKLEEIIKELCA